MHNKKIRFISLIITILLTATIFSYYSEGTSGKTIFVDDEDIADYTSIQDAIYNSTESDTIYVYYGTYNETLTITHEVKLIGLDKPTICGIKQEDTTVSILVDNVTLDGFIIKSSNTANSTKGVYIKSDNNKIINCSIISHYRGIYLYNAKNNFICNNIFQRNKLSGIDLIRSDKNHVISNNFYNNEVYAVNLWNSNRNIIEKNNIYNNLNTGIYLSSSSNNSIIKNTFQNNGIYGITLFIESNNNNLFYNNFIDNSNQAFDECINTWYNTASETGNYWNSYETIYSDAVKLDGLWNIPYNISGGNNKDFFPLVENYVEKDETNHVEEKKENNPTSNNINLDGIFILTFITITLIFSIIFFKKKK